MRCAKIACALLVSGCAAGGAEQKPAAPPAGGSPQQSAPAPEADDDGSGADGAMEESPAYAQPPPQPGAGAGADTLAWQELERAEQELQSAAGDCGTACRALASMERAAERICTLLSEEHQRCATARDRVRTARRRVERGCGECA